MYKTQAQPLFFPVTNPYANTFHFQSSVIPKDKNPTLVHQSKMMHCLNAANSETADMTVPRLKWHQQQLIPLSYFNQTDQLGSGSGGAFLAGDQGLCELVNGAMKPDPGLENGLTGDFRRFLGTEFELSYTLPRTVSCPENAAVEIGDEAAAMISGGGGTEIISSKKRKADKTHNLKVIEEDKKMKGSAEEDSKITDNKSTTTTTSTTGSTAANTKNNAKESFKASEAPKTDYIHVRARRGQATDSHSLAERVRREKISERMKYLQDLVPGCNKITGKAGMLDEIINYVQSLQRQVEFLSMKLAAINPRLDFDVESYLVKEIIGASSSDQFNLQFNTLGQGSSNLGMVGNDPMDMALRRTTSAPITIPHTFLDSSSLNQIQHLPWDDELQNLYNMEYQQGRSTSFVNQPFTGFQEQGHVKLEM